MRVTSITFAALGASQSLPPILIAYLHGPADQAAISAEDVPEGTIWTCPMHPQIRQMGPGSCPICGMALEPLEPTLDEGPNPDLIDMSRRFWVSATLSIPLVIPMALLMLWMMPSMFPDLRTNIILNVTFAALFLFSLYGMRTQALIGDYQFLRSMIPHHSGAILMCEKSSISDPSIARLCDGIVAGQKAEIAEMKALLAR